jgi:dCMP deaminase
MGYNGFARGVEDTPERYADRPTKYKLVVHAEVNAILDAGEKAIGSTLYVYPTFAFPPVCSDCCKFAIQSGIIEIVGYDATVDPDVLARWEESIKTSEMMCGEANIKITRVPIE